MPERKFNLRITIEIRLKRWIQERGPRLLVLYHKNLEVHDYTRALFAYLELQSLQKGV